MDQIKETLKNLSLRKRSLRKSLMIYVALLALLAVILSGATEALCNDTVSQIRASYPVTGEKYYLTNELGERLGEGAYIGTASATMLERDSRLVGVLELLPMIMTPVYSALCILLAAFLFYRNRLKAPLTELKKASENISRNNLDFVVACGRKDEMGELCASFETMRSALADNFSEIWRSMEERKRLNAAFAHDLRTPLTVLKGYAEILSENRDKQVQETAGAMERQLSRMERYVEGMSGLLRLEDMRPQLRETALQPFLASLYESADMLCRQRGKKLRMRNSTSSRQLLLDPEFVSQVSSNLISNAARYAEYAVELAIEEIPAGILLSVSDDGPGFEKEIMDKAFLPYVTGEKGSTEHFGMGLSICRILCERHGGWIKAKNTALGGKVTVFFRG